MRALAVFPTIGDLAEALELKIRYTWALTLSEILNKPASVKPTDFWIPVMIYRELTS